MPTTIALPLIDGTRVVVPDSLDLLTPYVLREQEDWFEDEIRFLREVVQPGQRVIDIGANYGVYTLSMARSVGAEGQVWAFEPASKTAAHLRESIAVNGYAQVSLLGSALSDHEGSARLSLHDNAEMNSLQRSDAAAGDSETVELTTLDAAMRRFGWEAIDFVKIDAEGEEAAILRGGQRFFAENSPLVQYEIMAGGKAHLELVAAFAAQGYASYRLVPGLGLLAPFVAGDAHDRFQLNLFCCKPDRAERLAAAGRLAAGVAAPPAARDWRRRLTGLAYANAFAAKWEATMAHRSHPDVIAALAWHDLAADPQLAAPARLAALRAALDTSQRLCQTRVDYLRLATLARIARDFGARAAANAALTTLCNAIVQSGHADPSEPFLAPEPRFEDLAPASTPGEWILAAALEAFEQLNHFSSFFTGTAALQRLDLMHKLGYAGAAMQRRSRLIRGRFGLPAQP